MLLLLLLLWRLLWLLRIQSLILRRLLLRHSRGRHLVLQRRLRRKQSTQLRLVQRLRLQLLKLVAHVVRVRA